MKIPFARIIRRIEKASYRWNSWIITVASISIILTMLLVVSDVSARYLFNSPIRGAVEVEQIILAYISFTGLAYALIKGNHVRVTLLLNRLSPRMRLGAEIIASLAGIAFFCLVVWGGIGQFWESWIIQEIMPASVEVPFWIAKLAMPLGAILITVQFIIAALRDASTLLAEREEG